MSYKKKNIEDEENHDILIRNIILNIKISNDNMFMAVSTFLHDEVTTLNNESQEYGPPTVI